MPRHPPCALKNLATHTTRCSRPLCSSQNTDGHQPMPHQQHRPAPQARTTPQHQGGTNPGNTPQQKQGPFPQDPTVCPQPAPTTPTAFLNPPQQQAVLATETIRTRNE